MENDFISICQTIPIGGWWWLEELDEMEFKHHDPKFVCYVSGRKRSKREKRDRNKGSIARYLELR